MRSFMKHGFTGVSLHRFPKGFAEFLAETAGIMKGKYDGDPRNIWAKQLNERSFAHDCSNCPGSVLSSPACGTWTCPRGGPSGREGREATT